MNVEIGAEAAQFPEKEYINGIVFAVQVKGAAWQCKWHSDRNIGHTESQNASI
jgi:hypothetical protein